MSCFPLFIELEGASCLVAGGGAVALRKAEKLLPYGPRLTVTAPELLPGLETLAAAHPGRVTLCRRAFAPSDLEGQTLVIAATSDSAANRQIAALCRARGLPVNVADDPESGSFLFPALVKRGPLSIGISTGGASPAAAVYVKQAVQAALPPQGSDGADPFAEILSYLAAMRAPVKAALPTEAQRAPAFAALFSACMARGRPLTDAESAPLLAGCADPAASQAAGKVFLVGAGCGSADLITVRGLRLLRACTDVVYDDLIDPALLEEAPSAARWPVGKRCGRHSAPQQQINALLVRLARAGKTVVRLKGGDPFVFGRGGEEALALQAAAIPFEVVPGVSSAIAAPQAAGIPVTHRQVSRSFHVLTGHAAGADSPLAEPPQALAALQGTLVFLMGLSRLEGIAAQLMDAGKPGATPAAVVRLGAAPGELPAVVRGTLADIAVRTRAAGMQPPAVIVVGDTAALELR